jgi:hypothetical protein
LAGTTNTIQHDTDIIEDNFNYVTEIGIYGLPGTIFEVNGDGTIVLNGSGLLSLGREDFPITSLKCTNLGGPKTETINGVETTTIFSGLYTDNSHCLIIDVVGEAKSL